MFLNSNFYHLKGPNPFELRELIDPKTGKLFEFDQLIQKRIIYLVSSNRLNQIENLILYGYEYLENVNSRSAHFKSAKHVAKHKGFGKMSVLLNSNLNYRIQMSFAHEALLEANLNRFIQMIGEKQISICKLSIFPDYFFV